MIGLLQILILWEILILWKKSVLKLTYLLPFQTKYLKAFK